MNKLIIAILMILFIIFVIGIFFIVENSHINQIETWAINNRYKITSNEYVYMWDSKCPLWRHKNDSVRRAEMKDQYGETKVYYFRFGLFGMECEEGL